MQILYARQSLPKSIFLAGPTPRDSETKSWRPEALEILKALNFDGTVFIPEDDSWAYKDNYDDQVEWELQALHSASVIAFWVPRELNLMPAFTTNVEFGMLAHRQNVVLGYPKNAPKMKYLETIANLYYVPTCHSLQETMIYAVGMANKPFWTGGPKFV